jgi:hypothetical protein
MRVHLGSDIHMVAVGVDLVVLDIAADAYACLPDAAWAVARGCDGALEIDVDLVETFAEAGFLAVAGGARPDPLLLPPAARFDLCGYAPAARGPGISLMARAFAGMLGRYYGAPLKRLVATARRGRRGAAVEGDLDEVADHAARFDHLLPWVPFQGECLFRAFMLLTYLRLAGHDATWVFGVRTWPFQAHCWLQSGPTVLNDAVERVRPFTPIFAV